MVLDNHILLCVHLRSIFLKAVKQKSCTLTPLVYYCYGFKEAHPASNVTWVTLEMPVCRILQETLIENKRKGTWFY